MQSGSVWTVGPSGMWSNPQRCGKLLLGLVSDGGVWSLAGWEGAAEPALWRLDRCPLELWRDGRTGHGRTLATAGLGESGRRRLQFAMAGLGESGQRRLLWLAGWERAESTRGWRAEEAPARGGAWWRGGRARGGARWRWSTTVLGHDRAWFGAWNRVRLFSKPLDGLWWVNKKHKNHVPL
jgi:hypothetical protein